MDRITRHSELLARSGGDPWVRWHLPDPLDVEVWLHQDVALVQRVGRRPGFWVAPLRLGRPATAATATRAEESSRVRAALLALRDGGHLGRLGAEAVSVVQEHADVAHEVLDLGEGGDWDWMWCDSAPPVDPRERAAVILDDTEDAAELEAFTRAHNPRVWTEIGTGRVSTWRGVRDETGALLAIGGAQLADTGIPHLAGIVTSTTHRGRGLAGVVSGALTQWALQRHGACTLGMFSDNGVARRVYERLGYRTARSWHSRTLGEVYRLPG